MSKKNAAGRRDRGTRRPAGKRGTCRYCGCRQYTPCITDEGPCAWADHSQTLCTNPSCLQAAKEERRKEKA